MEVTLLSSAHADSTCEVDVAVSHGEKTHWLVSLDDPA